jgi:hypothetical protein
MGITKKWGKKVSCQVSTKFTGRENGRIGGTAGLRVAAFFAPVFADLKHLPDGKSCESVSLVTIRRTLRVYFSDKKSILP